jgi:hypothetical protein
MSSGAMICMSRRIPSPSALILVTNNERAFARVEGLTFENWLR